MYQSYIGQIAEAVNRFCGNKNYHIAVIGMEKLDSIMKELGLQDSFLYSVADLNLREHLYDSLRAMEDKKEDIQNQIENKKIYYYETLEQMGGFLKNYVYQELLTTK